MSGFAAPSLTTTPTPTRARLARLPATSLPLLARASTAAGVSTARSNVSPPSIRLVSAPTVSLSTMTLLPLVRSKSGTSASSTCLKAPAVRTLISAAAAGRAAPTPMSTMAIPTNIVRIASSIRLQ
jgi:hypothetical protein